MRQHQDYFKEYKLTLERLNKLRSDPRWMPEDEEVFDTPVLKNIKYHKFVSKSKGWRVHKDGTRVKRFRKAWQEVNLLSYRNGAHLTPIERMKGKKFTSYHKFPFDGIADECLELNRKAEPYELQNKIDEIWGY